MVATSPHATQRFLLTRDGTAGVSALSAIDRPTTRYAVEPLALEASGVNEKNRATSYVVRIRRSIYQSRKSVQSVDDQPVTYCTRVDVVEYQPGNGASAGTARVDFDVLEVVVFVADCV